MSRWRRLGSECDLSGCLGVAWPTSVRSVLGIPSEVPGCTYGALPGRADRRAADHSTPTGWPGGREGALSAASYVPSQ